MVFGFAPIIYLPSDMRYSLTVLCEMVRRVLYKIKHQQQRAQRAKHKCGDCYRSERASVCAVVAEPLLSQVKVIHFARINDWSAAACV